MRVEAQRGVLVEPIPCPGISIQGLWFIEVLYFETFPFQGKLDKTGGLYKALGEEKERLPSSSHLVHIGSLRRKFWKWQHTLLGLLEARSQEPLATRDKALVMDHQLNPYNRTTGSQWANHRQHPKDHTGGLDEGESLWQGEGRENEALWSLVSKPSVAWLSSRREGN